MNMIARRFILFATLLCSALFPLHQCTAQDTNGGDDEKIRWVVTFQDGILPDQLDNLLNLAGIELPAVELTIPELFVRVYRMSPAVAKRVAKLPVVEVIEQDTKVKLPPPVEQQSLDITALLQGSDTEYTPYGINMVQALNVDDSNTGTRIVCVIDSGFDLGHEDLPGTDAVTGSDNIGVQPWFQDDNSHGTHVTGTIAALGNNNKGVIGVNRNGLLNLHIVRIFDESGEAFGSDTVAVVQECINVGANVVNMSFGRTDDGSVYDGPKEFERRAFDKFYNEGTLLVAAAGNEGIDAYNWPASYESVMSVAAVNENKVAGSFSQRNDAVDIAAPGVEVASTIPNDAYEYFSGTSMACPHVSGVAALVWSNFPDKSAQDIWQALIASAEDLGASGRDDLYGFGLVQAQGAMDFLAGGDSFPTPTPSPPDEDPTTPPPEECVDDTTWTDATGDGCDWYSNRFLCQAFALLFSNDGRSAFDACCACGGGLGIQSGDSTTASGGMQLASSALPLFAVSASLAIVVL